MHGEERRNGCERGVGDDGIGMGEGPVAVVGFHKVPKKVGLDELPIGGGAQLGHIPENHLGFVAVESGRGTAAVVIPEETDKIETDLGAGERRECCGHVDAGKLLPTGSPGPVVGGHDSGMVEGGLRPLARVKFARRLSGRGHDQKKGQNQRKDPFRVHERKHSGFDAEVEDN